VLQTLLDEATTSPLTKGMADTIFSLLKLVISRETTSQEDKQSLLLNKLWITLVLPRMGQPQTDSDTLASCKPTPFLLYRYIYLFISLCGSCRILNFFPLFSTFFFFFFSFLLVIQTVAYFVVAEPAAFGSRVFDEVLDMVQSYVSYHPVDGAGFKTVRAVAALPEVAQSRHDATVREMEDFVTLLSRIVVILTQERASVVGIHVRISSPWLLTSMSFFVVC